MNENKQDNFNVNLDDLMFILKRIRIAEASADAVTGAVNGQMLRELVGSPLLPWGLRTVDGTWNSYAGHGKDGSGRQDHAAPDRRHPRRNAQPRIISHLIVDQTRSNPAASVAA